MARSSANPRVIDTALYHRLLPITVGLLTHEAKERIIIVLRDVLESGIIDKDTYQSLCQETVAWGN